VDAPDELIVMSSEPIMAEEFRSVTAANGCFVLIYARPRWPIVTQLSVGRDLCTDTQKDQFAKCRTTKN